MMILLLLVGAAAVAAAASKSSPSALSSGASNPAGLNPYLEMRGGLQYIKPANVPTTRAFLDTRDATTNLGAFTGDLPMPPTGRTVALVDPGAGDETAFNATLWVRMAVAEGFVVLGAADGRPLLSCVAQGHESLWCKPGGRWAVLAGGSA